jgi:glycosyltransferase involved in cell wall biosynthesis
MRQLILAKSPPTQGGEASKTFWIARGLAQRGHDVHIVTNANETDRAFYVEDARDPGAALPSGATVHFIAPEVEFHVPFHLAFCERLASMALQVYDEYRIEVIDAAHLTPFGVAALIVKACTGSPFVQRHGGSDVGYLWKSASFGPLLNRVVQAADRLMINPELAGSFTSIGVPSERLTPFRYFVDLREFHPNGARSPLIPEGPPVILFSGKITPGKRLLPLLQALRNVSEPFTLVILPVAFKTTMVEELVRRYDLQDRVVVLDPRPPWEMPAVLRSVDIVACLETGFTTPNHWPLFPREVFASGACLLLSREQYERRALLDARDGEHLVVADPDDPDHLRNAIGRVLRDARLRSDIGRRAAELATSIEDFDAMIDDLEQTYEAAIGHAAAYA